MQRQMIIGHIDAQLAHMTKKPKNRLAYDRFIGFIQCAYFADIITVEEFSNYYDRAVALHYH